MKPWVIKLLIGLGGFGGGFAAGFFCHKKINDVKFEVVTEEEMAAIEEKVGKAEKDVSASSSNAGAQGTDGGVSTGIAAGATTDDDLPEDVNQLRNVLQGKKPYLQADAESKMAYEKLWKATKEYSSEENANDIPVFLKESIKKVEAQGTDGESEDGAESEHPGEEDFDEDFLEQIEQEAQEAGNSFVEPPHQIDLPEFYNGRPEYDKVTIKFYEPDKVWVDENDEIIADIASYVGMANRNVFATEPMDDDPDVRFFRNERYGTDYEMVRYHRSYRETFGM